MSIFEKLLLISCGALGFILYCVNESDVRRLPYKPCSFILITVLYNETHPGRIQEYLTCLKNNMSHPLISRIHVLYDSSKDGLSEKHILRDYLQEKGIEITAVGDRPTYGDCFALVNNLYPGKSIILANADIYFNDSLSALNDYDLKGKFLALTRWNVCSDGRVVPFNVPYKTITQDVWIFESPIRQFEDDHILIGTNECDSFIAYQAQISGLKVLNPCLTIQCCHLHLSNIRNYEFNKHSTLPVAYRPAPWSRL